MEEIIKYLETLPKEALTHIVYKLMVKGKLSYSDITTLHIQNMERLSKAESEAYFRLQAEVMKLVCGNKKDRGKNIKDVLQLLYNEGRINVTQEKIDKYR